MKNNFFNVLSEPGMVESAKNFDMATLMKDVKMQETASHLYISNFPGAFGDTQNKNNRVYDWESLVSAVEQFNSIKDENPYFCYMFDGHKDDDSYENIVGRVVKLHLNESLKCVYIDMKVNKGARSQPTIKSIMMEGDPLGASMRILSPNTINMGREELSEINPDILFLDEDDAGIAGLMAKDSDIEYITGQAFIWRFDITQFPSFNSSFVAKEFTFDPKFNKSESAVDGKLAHINLEDYKETAPFFNSTETCVTNACKFRYTIKDFVDLINMDESIDTIKDHPELYKGMLQFSYLNLDYFDFNNIIDSDYLSQALTEEEITLKSAKKQNKAVSEIASDDNIVSYLLNNKEFHATKMNVLLNKTINAVVDEDNIFYQVVTLNYLHFIILATIVLTGSTGAKINAASQVKDKLESDLGPERNDKKMLVDLIKDVSKDNITLYKYMNSVFSYIYKYVNEYSAKMAPLTIVNESMKVFRPVKQKGVVSNKYVK